MGESITSTVGKSVNKFVGSVVKTTNSAAQKVTDHANTHPKDTYTPSASGQSHGPVLNGREAASLMVNWSKASTPKPDSYFSYKKRNFSDYSASRNYWSSKTGTVKSPTAANIRINGDYDTINRDMQRYLAGDVASGHKLPHTADWTSYGKYASREAGEFIRATEDVISTVLHPSKASLNSTEGILRHDLSWENVRKGLGGLTNGVLSPLDGIKTLANGPSDLKTLNKALTAGNTGIHQNIAPAYDAFLKGESDGGQGLDSLKKAGYYKGSSKDRQGFVTEAFSNYQNARELGVKAQHSKNPTEQKKLEEQRQKLMERGNLLLGYQEQMEILQKPSVFEQEPMGRLMNLFEETMTITDENGKFDLLPDGGNWTDFATRMGLKKVAPGTAGADAIRGTDGKVTHYLPDPSKKGTIIDYFNSRSEGVPAWKLNVGSPRDVQPLNFTGIMLGDE